MLLATHPRLIYNTLRIRRNELGFTRKNPTTRGRERSEVYTRARWMLKQPRLYSHKEKLELEHDIAYLQVVPGCFFEADRLRWWPVVPGAG